MLNLRREGDYAIITFYYASDSPQMATLQGGILPIVHAAGCGLLGGEQDPLPVQDNSIQFKISTRYVRIIKIKK